MWSTAREIAEGDLVIIWMTRDLVQPLVVRTGQELNMRFGVYRHADLVGVPYGSKVGSRNGRGFIHVLRPTPELWTLALPHRTQILYLADIAFVTNWLDIKPGSRVIEAGTGSGSFSHSTARTIGSTGHLWSYEFHRTRAEKAKEEFERHGMDDIVTLTHRNVCKDGFTVVDTADAVFLDLPAPWEAVPHAKVALRKDRTTRICCFSPCMEQVLRTVSALNNAGFTEITMYETLMRPQQVEAAPTPRSVRDVGRALQRADVRREERRLRQIAQAQAAQAKRKRENEEAQAGGQGTDAGDGDGDGENRAKRARMEELQGDEGDRDDAMAVDSGAATPAPVPVPTPAPTPPTHIPTSTKMVPAAQVERNAHGGEQEDEDEDESAKISVSKTFAEVRGHTSYLTFAVLLPESVRALAAAVAAEAGGSRPESALASRAGSQAASAVGTPAPGDVASKTE